MSASISSSWRGVVGVIKPTFRPGPLEEFIRLLPEGIGVIPLIVGTVSGAEQTFLDALETTKAKIAELAKLKVDLIHPESTSVFTLRGYTGAQEIVDKLVAQYGIPILPTGMMVVEAFKALGIKKLVGVTYHQLDELNQKNAQYFRDAGFDILAMEGMSCPFADLGKLSFQEVYAFAKSLYLKHPDAQGIYLLGSGWRVLDVIELLEQDLQIPVVQDVAVRVWAIQKKLHVRQPVQGYGRLLAEMP